MIEAGIRSSSEGDGDGEGGGASEGTPSSKPFAGNDLSAMDALVNAVRAQQAASEALAEGAEEMEQIERELARELGFGSFEEMEEAVEREAIEEAFGAHNDDADVLADYGGGEPQPPDEPPQYHIIHLV